MMRWTIQGGVIFFVAYFLCLALVGPEARLRIDGYADNLYNRIESNHLFIGGSMAESYQANISFGKELGVSIEAYKAAHPARTFSKYVQDLIAKDLRRRGFYPAPKKA
jgi:hypothetical protein